MGSGGIGPADRWAGSQYLVEGGAIGKQMFAFGFVQPRWARAGFYEGTEIAVDQFVAHVIAMK